MAIQVSVIVPVFNAEAFLEPCLRSALSQTEVEEILVVDDGSTDGSLGLATHMAWIEPRIRLLQHDDRGHHGAGAARNLGISQSLMPVLAFLDADDVYLEGRFAAANGVLNANSSLDGVFEPVEAGFEDPLAYPRWRRFGDGRRVTRLSPKDSPRASV